MTSLLADIVICVGIVINGLLLIALIAFGDK